MKENTRYLIMLLGVLTLLTSSYVVISTAGNGSNPQPRDEVRDNPTAPENSTNVNDPSPEEPENKSGNISDPDNIIEKSIYGYQIMIKDIKAAMGITS